MTNRTYLTGARVVLPDTVLDDSAVLVEHGRIAAIEPDGASAAAHVDLTGQTLIPGLVDLHCDAIEKEVEPRARVLFPLDFAASQIDRRNAAAGITTPFHAISFASADAGVRDNDTAQALVRAVAAFRRSGLVDNRIHCRYEVTDAAAAPRLHQLLDDGIVDLLSVMDHSPGQGQFRTLDAYVDYLTGNHRIGRDAAHEIAAGKLASRAGANERMSALLAHAQRTGVPTASHDDDSAERVAAMKRLGIRMTEFPTNDATARAATGLGLPTLFGAPNVLRGKSQSGSMRAIDAIRACKSVCLCSDYQPSTLVVAAFIAADQARLDLPSAIALVTRNSADACGLADRGRIAVGARADLVSVSFEGRWPMVTNTWSAGRHVFSARYPQRAAAGGLPDVLRAGEAAAAQ
ncbi:phosphonate metabolism protein PhnM [Burkholderia sp. ABCPW 14]|uniref:alpha-D-ribose 1-methylphosphonate 5-triphosphate diphosphatase n=1 Tax=Burkholderia sp. ABCPW 14 TaxID=1637860 RepID=UPI000770DD07|nr:alpha-D-ribose 1-methylphosphonate 5-triphosphate diphosphatase [Burkholderia sp. ABCPW 14]KVD84431.1 phosphonate metabolism protein PhnM [Burkholderia sp. ABCPW 14]